MNAPIDSLGSALGRRFAVRARCPARDRLDSDGFNARTQNKRRNLNLDLIELMQTGKGLDSPEVQAIRAELAKLPA